MSSERYIAFVKCDAPGCTENIGASGLSRELAQTYALANARSAGWKVAPDRLHDNRDMCPAHGKGKQ